MTQLVSKTDGMRLEPPTEFVVSLQQPLDEQEQARSGQKQEAEKMALHPEHRAIWDVSGFMGFIIKLLSRSSETSSRLEDRYSKSQE